MDSNRNIALNFLPLAEKDFTFKVYRRSRIEGEKKPDPEYNFAKLPIDAIPEQEKLPYWVVFKKAKGFEEFNCHSDFDWKLTKRFLLYALKLNSSRANEYQQEQKFRKFVSFVLREYSEGKETIWLEPYYLQPEKTFGFLIDFEFKTNPHVPFSKRIQVLSLSLDKSFRSNKNFYADKYGRVMFFIQTILPSLFPIAINVDIPLNISNDLYPLKSFQLKTKEYVFDEEEHRSKSQFKGLKDYGPLRKIPKKVGYYFMCRQQDTDYANQLYKALRGDTFESTFPGMSSVFRTSTEKGLTKGKTLNLDKPGFEEAIREIREMQNGAIIPILLLPSKYDPQYTRIYFLAKYLFAKESLPLQVVTIELLRNEESLKWSIANIGLQIFAKLGGQPWKVKPENNDCLIIGIGQAHKLVKEGEKTKVEKYYAYSVLTDSSGLYLDLRVIGEGTDQKEYLSALKDNLTTIIQDHKGQFKKFVIHTSFKISNEENDAILEIVRPQSEKNQGFDFAVLKVNTENKFFGYDLNINSLVPYESTYLRIAPKEYLVWFEGLQYHNPNVLKRYPGPTHVELLFSSSAKDMDITYLQDVLNLSGANWRGFNAKALPVSIHYCRLVAKFIQEFDHLGYKDYKIDNLQPWFL